MADHRAESHERDDEVATSVVFSSDFDHSDVGLDRDSDNSVALGRPALGFHPGHCQLPGGVDGLREIGEFLVFPATSQQASLQGPTGLPATGFVPTAGAHGDI